MDCDDRHKRVWRALQRAARSLGRAKMATTDEERIDHLTEAKNHVDDAGARIATILTGVWCSCPPDVCTHRRGSA